MQKTEIKQERVMPGLSKVLTDIYRQSAEEYVRKFVPGIRPSDVRDNTYVVCQKGDSKGSVDVSIEYFGGETDYPEKEIKSAFPMKDPVVMAGMLDMMYKCGIRYITGMTHLQYIGQDMLKIVGAEKTDDNNVVVGIGLHKDYVESIQDEVDSEEEFHQRVHTDIQKFGGDIIKMRDLMELTDKCLNWKYKGYEPDTTEGQMLNTCDKVFHEIKKQTSVEYIRSNEPEKVMSELFKAVGYDDGSYKKIFKK